METKLKERNLFIKLCRYCAYRERAISEVVLKMNRLEIELSEHSKYIALLKKEKFLNEKRFAESFAHGKFRNNSWGKSKIIRTLREKGIQQKDIELAIFRLDQEQYLDKIKVLIHKKIKNYKKTNLFHTRRKIAHYLIQKGYEPNLVWENLKQELPDQ